MRLTLGLLRIHSTVRCIKVAFEELLRSFFCHSYSTNVHLFSACAVVHESILTPAPQYTFVKAEWTALVFYMCTQTHAGLSSCWESLTGWGPPGAPANAENVWQRTGRHMSRRWFPSIPCIIAYCCARVTAGVCLCLCVCLTHERACAADETEEAALGWKSPAFTADKDRKPVKYYTHFHSCLSEKRKSGRAQRQRLTSQQQALDSLPSPSLLGMRRFCRWSRQETVNTGRLCQTPASADRHHTFLNNPTSVLLSIF